QRLADGLCGNAGNSRVREDRGQDNTTRGDLGAFSNLDVAKNPGTRSDHDAAADLRVAIAALLPRPAQGNRLQDRDIVLDHGRFTDDYAGAVVDEHTAPDARRRVYVHRKH